MYSTANLSERPNFTHEGKLTKISKKGVLQRTSKKTSGAEMLSVEDVHSLTIESLENSKAEKIQSINITKKSSIGDYMVIASGRSHRHVGAVADLLVRDLKKAGIKMPRVEGRQNGDWVLIDIGDIIIHLFRPEVREFYNLEKMWMLPVMSDSQSIDSGKSN